GGRQAEAVGEVTERGPPVLEGEGGRREVADDQLDVEELLEPSRFAGDDHPEDGRLTVDIHGTRHRDRALPAARGPAESPADDAREAAASTAASAAAPSAASAAARGGSAVLAALEGRIDEAVFPRVAAERDGLVDEREVDLELEDVLVRRI